MLEVCSGVINEKEKGGGIQEVRKAPTERVVVGTCGIQEVGMAPTGRVAVGTWWSYGCKGLMSFL